LDSQPRSTRSAAQQFKKYKGTAISADKALV